MRHIALSPDRLFHGIHPKGIVIAAVSGGSDSLALLLLANAWADRNNLPLHAVTVDHGLRPEAAAEASYVASLCFGLGIDHTTLAWDGIRPHSGIAEAARRARYALIEEFALEIGADIILTGHTSGDQAETISMRLARQAGDGKSVSVSTGRGLAGMARTTRLPGGCQLSRPLLDVTRAQLRAYLAAFPQSWIEDPSNDDGTFERVAIRRTLQHDPERTRDLLRFGRVMSEFRAVLSQDTADLLAATVRARPGGVVEFDHLIARDAPRPVLLHALQVVLAVAGGGEYLPASSKVSTLLDAIEQDEFPRVTLARAVVETAGSKLRFYREKRDIPAIRVEPGEKCLWDGRLEIVNAGTRPLRVTIASPGMLREIENQRHRKFRVQPRAALLTCGLVEEIGGDFRVPLAESLPRDTPIKVRMTARAIEHFCPQSDFALLEWLLKLDRERSEILQSGA